jgi:hypothetical protein
MPLAASYFSAEVLDGPPGVCSADVESFDPPSGS